MANKAINSTSVFLHVRKIIRQARLELCTVSIVVYF